MEEIAPIIIIIGGITLAVLWSMNGAKRAKIDDLEKRNEYQRKTSQKEIERLNSAQNEHNRKTQEKHIKRIRELKVETKRLADINHKTTANLTKLSERQRGLLAIIEEKNSHFPWLATAFSDYQDYLGKMDAALLLSKKRPAPKAVEKIKEATRRASNAEKRFRSLKYRIDFYEKYFPWIMDVTGDSLEEFLNAQEAIVSPPLESQNDDPVRNMLSQQEYAAFSTAERNQLALDRWKSKRKSNWEIGRMYERYIGYLYEEQGNRVEYFGAIKGLDDLGRDLIVRKSGETMIVQCKYWAKEKTIHEKHIFQLFGTVVEHIARTNSNGESLPLFETFTQLSDIRPVFVTSTVLSERAKEFAALLKVEVRESVPFGDYPIIKCNISKRNGERVYHLPFDQQYDRTVIEPEEGEFYAWTTDEAEKQGFRRAHRWRPERGD
ncbi:restriction endonuclease [Profundibacter amoris]|uniref:Restriction endonuclease type IV Mrr domain-containing protein n=1 Tax=Profundibacter amoris TaxID=2171755 RepID=A0A347UES9_9RHOB|nr:restriction endonuclease [Profundibacter amoris]AXX97357.1 hypothetical protein BAR1_05085 [Profundibacter amoris]